MDCPECSISNAQCSKMCRQMNIENWTLRISTTMNPRSNGPVSVINCPFSISENPKLSPYKVAKSLLTSNSQLPFSAFRPIIPSFPTFAKATAGKASLPDPHYPQFVELSDYSHLTNSIAIVLAPVGSVVFLRISDRHV